jgi:hypothetical protein
VAYTSEQQKYPQEPSIIRRDGEPGGLGFRAGDSIVRALRSQVSGVRMDAGTSDTQTVKTDRYT